MGYYIDIEKITLDEYKKVLEDAYMIPSRAMLKENIYGSIEKFKTIGIKNVAQLQKLLKSKAKIEDVSKKIGLDQKYLNALRLELNAYVEKPTQLTDFECLSENVKTKLASAGIKTTLDVYDRVQSAESRNKLSTDTGISADEILMAAKLSDLSRIRWVNHTFAYVLHEAGYDTVAKVADADHEKLYGEVLQMNKEKQLYKGNIGKNDMLLLVKLAKALPIDIKY
ncbi:MAG: DUF4332 domain-containing protein [Eubacteriales bacterium]